MLLSLCSRVLFSPPPSPIPTRPKSTDIIAKFAAKEAAFAQGADNYTYRQTASVMTLDDGGDVTGKWEEVTDIVFSPEGARIEKVAYAPPNTLTAIQLDPGDIQDLRDVQPFVLTTERTAEILHPLSGPRAIGRNLLLRLRRQAEKDGIGQALFRGRSLGGRSRLADRQELRPRRRHNQAAIINIRSSKPIASRSTANIGSPPTPSPTPRCTSRKTISASKMTVKYEDYKQFKSDIKIKYDDATIPEDAAPRRRRRSRSWWQRFAKLPIDDLAAANPRVARQFSESRHRSSARRGENYARPSRVAGSGARTSAGAGAAPAGRAIWRRAAWRRRWAKSSARRSAIRSASRRSPARARASVFLPKAFSRAV